MPAIAYKRLATEFELLKPAGDSFRYVDVHKLKIPDHKIGDCGRQQRAKILGRL